MVAKLTKLTHKIAIQLHVVAESHTICSSSSRRPVRKLLDAHSYVLLVACFRIIDISSDFPFNVKPSLHRVRYSEDANFGQLTIHNSHVRTEKCAEMTQH